jgi:23S rRNA pseudouridine1911/1915/1917 synthase
MEQDSVEKARSTNLVKQITILYQDKDVLVIDKPAGLLVHEDGRKEVPTVVAWFLAHVPEARGVGEPGNTSEGRLLERSGVVHRLDAETSGVLILAKTQEAFRHLKEQFHDRLVKKEYHAFVYGAMKERYGTIQRSIGRSPRDTRLRSADRGARGKLRDAVTHWEVIGQSDTHAYLKLFPKTGRTHQIRVHLRAIGKPIVHDPLYAPPHLGKSDDLGFKRLALHAHALSIVLPNGEGHSFVAPLPDDFMAARQVVASA